MDIDSECWVAKKAELYITEGGQEDIIVNNILPALVAGNVHEVGTDSTLTPISE